MDGGACGALGIPAKLIILLVDQYPPLRFAPRRERVFKSIAHVPSPLPLPLSQWQFVCPFAHLALAIGLARGVISLSERFRGPGLAPHAMARPRASMGSPPPKSLKTVQISNGRAFKPSGASRESPGTCKYLWKPPDAPQNPSAVCLGINFACSKNNGVCPGSRYVPGNHRAWGIIRCA